MKVFFPEDFLCFSASQVSYNLFLPQIHPKKMQSKIILEFRLKGNRHIFKPFLISIFIIYAIAKPVLAPTYCLEPLNIRNELVKHLH